ncbi:MAG: YeiH family protein [Anaerolineae bacterium]|nr:YeiH family protein [Anaerolineae bacterium]
MKDRVLPLLPGIILSLMIAGVAYLLGTWIPVVGGAVFSITLGIIIASLWQRPVSFDAGIRFTSKYILQLAVILLGFEMSIGSVLTVGQQSLWVILITLSTAFITVLIFRPVLKINGTLGTLIGVGTAICGGSAIAAASSAIHADDQDVSYSISTIFLFNVIAVFLFPLMGHMLALSDTGFGMWAGTAINDTSSVVAASYSFSNAAGNFATIVKLTRSLMIVPVTLVLAIAYARRNKDENLFSFVKVFPWFVIGFLLAAIIRSLGLLPLEISKSLAWAGKFLIISAMGAIGLNTNMKKFITAGPKALALGGITWLAVMLSSLGIQLIGNMW